MVKPSRSFVCQSCGTVHPKWLGRCEGCGEWNSLIEEVVTPLPGSGSRPSSKTGANRRSGLALTDLAAIAPPLARHGSGLVEFDRVCGGGLVPGSALLIGGDPGIGKSTLLLQVMGLMARAGHRTIYITGEESVEQVRMRALRLGYAESPVSLAAETSLAEILPVLDGGEVPRIVVIDSIQTMFVDSLESAPGTVAQVRMSAQELIRLAKRRGFILVLVGHVTKDGMIAGPRVLEHMVDTVLYFEGDRGHQFRILRSVKNRFGPGDEIGVFAMTELGLEEVSNPSALFLSDRLHDISGSAVFAGMEGTRPLLVEIQALVAPGVPGSPRRAVVGWDSQRLAMVVAVLEARCGVSLAGKDIYLNVAGGLRINEPAADLAVAAALVSAFTGVAVPADTVVFGEIGLAGEIRPVGQSEARVKEALRLGFTRAILPNPQRSKSPATGSTRGKPVTEGMTILGLELLAELVDHLQAD
ncbi:MAG: DNA repair protein RadA [Alphaproteobacteria bacterium]|nr:DNA repair protein RadA [Alphaproteobacteria bacterium]